jgi:large conductance mechanosensitive channel
MMPPDRFPLPHSARPVRSFEVSGFKKFLLRGNLVDLAVAFVIGAAFAALVTSLVKDFVTPLIGIIGGKGLFADRSFTIHNSQFLYGDFIDALIAFVIVAAVIYYFVVMPFSALLDRYKKEPEPDAPVRQCPECLSSIPAAATRCSFCTAVSAPTPPVAV